MKIAVIGAGGVGGYFGGRLAQAGNDVHFLARGEHLRAIKEHGLRVRSVRGDFEVRASATDDPAEIGPSEYVLFCVKSFDTREAASKLGPLIQSGTAVISLQNGIDNEDAIAADVGWEHVMGGVAFIFASIAEPGVIEDAGGPGRGEIRAAPRAWAMFRRVVEEVSAVALAEGVDLGADAVDRHVGFAEELEAGGRSSLAHDKSAGRRMELEALHGTVVRLAAEHDIPVPACAAIYAILEPWAIRNEGGTAR